MRFHQAAAAVWDEAAGGDSPTPTLSLYSLPAGVKGVRHSPAGPPPPTPPINSLASVPFKWEEAPGKPRPRRLDDVDEDHQSKIGAATAARCLELPPRLVVSSSSRRVSNIPSPASIMSSHLEEEEAAGGGGLARRSMSFTHGSGRSAAAPGGRGVRFGSSRWGSMVMMKITTPTTVRKKDQQVANFDSTETSSSSFVDDQDRRSTGAGEAEQNVKITRIKRRRSLLNLSAASRPQACLNSMYRSFKKIVMVTSRRR